MLHFQLRPSALPALGCAETEPTRPHCIWGARGSVFPWPTLKSHLCQDAGSRRAVWSSAWPFCPPRGHTRHKALIVSRGTVTPTVLRRLAFFGKRAALAPATPAWPGAPGGGGRRRWLKPKPRALGRWAPRPRTPSRGRRRTWGAEPVPRPPLERESLPHPYRRSADSRRCRAAPRPGPADSVPPWSIRLRPRCGCHGCGRTRMLSGRGTHFPRPGAGRIRTTSECGRRQRLASPASPGGWAPWSCGPGLALAAAGSASCPWGCAVD